MAQDNDSFPSNSPPEQPAAGKLTRATPEVAAVEPRRIIPVTVAPAAPPALSSSPDAMALLKALRRRWFLAGALGCLGALLAATATWYLMPAKFLANALLQVSSKQQYGLERENNRETHSMLMKTSADRIKSRDVLMRALNQEGVRNLRLVRVHPDSLSTLIWMEENLKVDYREGSELLSVSLAGEDPNDLVVIVGALTKSFLQIVNGEDRKQRKDRLTRYKTLHVEAKEKLREKVAAKEDLLGAKGAKDSLTLLQQQMTAKARLDRAQEMLSNHQYDLDRKNAKLTVLQQQQAELEKMPAAEIPLKEIHEMDPDLKADAAKVVKLQSTIETLVNRGHPEGDSTLMQNRRQLDDVKKRVDKRVAELRSEMADTIRKKQERGLDTAIVEIRTEIAPLEAHIAKYQKDVDTLSKATEEISFWTAKQNLLESEILQQEKAVAQLFEAVQRAEVEDQAEPRITPIGEAEWQPRDVKKRVLMLVLAPLLALCCVVMAVAWWEFSARRIQGPDEVVAGLAMRVVGAVPELPDPRRLHLGSSSPAEEVYRHNLVESIDAIRTMLLRNAAAENLRTVMVTSAVGGEGKTTLASNLAMSLARAGRKTLLMDCDLRRPAAHQLFEQTLQPGFSEIALREVELLDAVRPTTTDPNLFLLPAGHWDREVIQELAKPGITAIFEKLRQEFDFIIVDSHPVLPATDSLLIGQHVDAVIVSLMRDLSQVHHVHAACQQLGTLGIRVFGAVVSGVPVKMYGKGYQYSAQPVA
jgi:capsular exopolysaccharide synthesis family protein